MNPAKSFSPALNCQAPGRELGCRNLLDDFSRHQLAVVMEIACALFRSSEAVRKIQQQTARHALLRYEATIQKLRTNCTHSDLRGIHSELMHFDLERASQYWQQLTAVALQTPVEIMTSASHIPDSQAGNSLRSMLSTFQAALPLVNGFFPHKPSYAIE